MRKLLAAVDFSEDSLPAARAAVELARRLGGEVTFLHAYHPWGDYFDPPGFREKMRPTLLGKLDELVEQIDAPGVEVKTALEEGRISRTIVDFAQRWHYDLIVVGTHGAGRAPRVAPGSTAERVVRSSAIPVLVVPSPSAEPAAARGR